MKRVGICVLIGVCGSLMMYGLFYLLETNKRKNRGVETSYDGELKIRIGNVDSDKKAIIKTLNQVRRRFSLDWDVATSQLNSNEFLLKIKKVDDTAAIKKMASESIELKFLETFTVGDLNEAFTGIEAELTKRRRAFNGVSDSSEKYEFLLEDVDVENKKKNGISSLSQLISFSPPYQDKSGRAIYPGALGLVKEKDTPYVNKLLKDKMIKSFIPANLFFAYGKENNGISNKEPFLNLYAVRMPDPEFDPYPTDENVEDCRADFEPMTGNPIITMKFDPAGSNYWYILTQRNIGKPIVIMANDLVLTAPAPESAIEGGESRITGNFTYEETKQLAGMIRAGRFTLPVKVTETSFTPITKNILSIWMLGLFFVLTTAMAYGISFLIKPASKP